MPRRVRDPSADQRDWITRAADAVSAAEKMPEGPSRDEAFRKAEQLRSAGEMMVLLAGGEHQPNRAARTLQGKLRANGTIR